MHIIFVNRFYRPDHSATAQMLTDLAEFLARDGQRVTVVTSRLTYQGGVRLPARERISDVDVVRVWTSHFGRSWLPGRAFDYATFYLSATLAMLRHVSRGDVLVAKTDPPLLSVPAAIVAKVKRAQLLNWCQDLFPEVAAALGMRWADGVTGKMLAWIRNWSLRQARFNAVLHQAMAERLQLAGVSEERVRVLPNWADPDLQSIAHEHNPLRRQWGLEGKFVIVYSGNLGRAHMPDRVAELVARTKPIPSLVWLFIGGGAGIDVLRKAAASAQNVLFKPYQPREQLSESLSVADAHLISLDPGCEGLIVPSKYYGVVAVARPIIFLGDSAGAVAREVAERGEGLVLDPDAPDQWVAAISGLVAGDGLAKGSPGKTLGNDLTDVALARWRDALADAYRER